MEIPRAGVVSQPLPGFPYSAGPRPCQRLEIWEALEKSRIVLRHAAHLRLLQHELGHEHAVRIARLAPWQVARGAGPPGEELAGKCLCARGLAHAGGRRTGHEYPRYSTVATVHRVRCAPCGWAPARTCARPLTTV